MHVETEPEVLPPRGALRDLVALSAIPAMWVGKEPPAVASGLADALVELLQLDFVFVRLSEPLGTGSVEIRRGSGCKSFPDWLEERLATSAGFPTTGIVAAVGDGPESCRGVAIRIGVNGEAGLVAAASERGDFPTVLEHLLISLAANHAAAAFENSLLIEERRRAEEGLREARDELEVKVAERTAELERSRAELSASRARIVTAADETRRRIERDLHDGVQQQLVAVVLELRTIEAEMPSADEPKNELARAADSLADALDELVEISRGIHPAVLAKGGLKPALRTLAGRSPVPVDLDLRIERRLPAPIEVAVYYVASEALTNVAKHAQASAVQLAVALRGDVLELSIEDDGCGGADATLGSGLIGLADRVDALEGTIEVVSPVGQGTALRITLPIRVG